MKAYDELTPELQAKAREKCLEDLLRGILDGLRFNDELNHDDLQARIDAAGEKANEMQTPWFAAEYMLEDEQVRGQLEGMARCDAEDACYPELGESVVFLKELQSVQSQAAASVR